MGSMWTGIVCMQEPRCCLLIAFASELELRLP